MPTRTLIKRFKKQPKLARRSSRTRTFMVTVVVGCFTATHTTAGRNFRIRTQSSKWRLSTIATMQRSARRNVVESPVRSRRPDILFMFWVDCALFKPGPAELTAPDAPELNPGAKGQKLSHRSEIDARAALAGKFFHPSSLPHHTQSLGGTSNKSSRISTSDHTN